MLPRRRRSGADDPRAGRLCVDPIGRQFYYVESRAARIEGRAGSIDRR